MKKLRIAFVSLLFVSLGAAAQVLPLQATPWSVQDSVALGAATFGGVEANVTDATGVPQPGVAFTFTTDPACGTYEGGSVFAGVTDSIGRAYGPLFYGVALSLSCPISFMADGMAEPLLMPMHVFDPANVVLTLSPAFLEVAAGSQFRVGVTMEADGLRVLATPLVVTVGTSASGATAVLDHSLCALTGGSCVGYFIANDRPGTYEIRVTYAGVSVAAEVKQRPH